MTYPVIFNWPAPDTQAICLTQSLGGAGNLIINGNLTINSIQPGNVILPGISRTVSLTSTSNLSGINFTINGILNNSSVFETRSGPNNNTVETTQLFDQVTSVTANGAVTSISIGTGTSGHTHWFSHDYNKSVPSLSLQGVVTGAITYTFNATLDNPNNVNPTVFNPIMALTNATGNQLQSLFGFPLSFSNVSITTGSTGSLVYTVVEGGLIS